MQAILQFEKKRTHLSSIELLRKMWQLTPDEPIEFSHSGWDESLNVSHSWSFELYTPDYERAEPNAGWEALEHVYSGVGMEPFKRRDWLWLRTTNKAEPLVIVYAYVVMVNTLMEQLPSVISLDNGKTWIDRDTFMAPYESILTLSRAEIFRVTALETLSITTDDEPEPTLEPLRW